MKRILFVSVFGLSSAILWALVVTTARAEQPLAERFAAGGEGATVIGAQSTTRPSENPGTSLQDRDIEELSDLVRQARTQLESLRLGGIATGREPDWSPPKDPALRPLYDQLELLLPRDCDARRESAERRAGRTPMTAARVSGWTHYGARGLEDGEGVAIGELSGDEEDVVVAGRITSVCPKKGCWMRVTDGDDELFVRFKEYSFFVPRNAADHRVVLHGRAEARVIPVDELRHYAQDAGKSEKEIAAITEPERSTTFYADSVYVEGDGLDEPWSPAATTQPSGR